MARIRSVHPSLFTDEAWVSCSPLARLLYIGLWTDADDQGLFEWKPLQIKMRLLPGDSADVAAMLNELVEGGLIASFEHGGKRFGAIKQFRKFQRPKKPNAVHVLPAEWRAFVCLDDPSSEPDGDEPDAVPNQSPTEGEKSPQMEDGGWRGEEDVTDAHASLDRERVLDELWEAYPHVKGRSSRPKSRKALELVPDDVLALLPKAARAFRKDCEMPNGPPALERWISDERWRDWLERAGPTLAPWVGPAEVRAAFAEAKGEPWTASWIDPSGWQDVPDRALIPASRLAITRIIDEGGLVLERLGILVLSSRTQAA